MNTLVRNTAKLLTANVVAQVVGLVVYPILTRLYSPADFGLLNLFLSIGSVMVLLANAEYYNAIVLPKEEHVAKGLVHVSMAITLIVVLVTLLSCFFMDSIATLFNTPELARWYWLMPLFVLVTATWNTLNYWYIRKEVYGRISGYQLGQSLNGALLKLIFGKLGFLKGGLIVSQTIAPTLSLLISVVLAWKKHLSSLLQWDREKFQRALCTYRNFPIYSMPRTIVNMVAGQLPVFLLTPVFGTGQVGLWSMAILLGFAPISMINKAMYQTFYQYTTEKVNREKPIGVFYRKFALYCLLVTLPTFFVLGWILPDLTVWMLGANWRMSGEYIRWMLPWLICSILTGSTSYLPDIFFRQRMGLFFEIMLAAARTIGVLLGVYLQSFQISIIGYSLGSAIVVLAQFVWQMSLVRAYDKTLAKAPDTLQPETEGE